MFILFYFIMFGKIEEWLRERFQLSGLNLTGFRLEIPTIRLARTVQLVLDQQQVKTKMENYFQRRLFFILSNKINLKFSKIVSAGWTLGLIQSGFIFRFFVLIYPLCVCRRQRSGCRVKVSVFIRLKERSRLTCWTRNFQSVVKSGCGAAAVTVRRLLF